MAVVPADHSKLEKEMVRKRTDSAMRKIVQTGAACNVFAILVYWDPTYKRLDGDGYLPKGVDIPDVNKFLKERFDDKKPGLQRKRRRNQLREKKKTFDETVVELNQTSSDGNEPDQDQRNPAPVQGDTADHADPEVSREDSNITETPYNISPDDRESENEQPADDMPGDCPQTRCSGEMLESDDADRHAITDTLVDWDVARYHSAQTYSEVIDGYDSTSEQLGLRVMAKDEVAARMVAFMKDFQLVLKRLG